MYYALIVLVTTSTFDKPSSQSSTMFENYQLCSEAAKRVEMGAAGIGLRAFGVCVRVKQ